MSLVAVTYREILTALLFPIPAGRKKPPIPGQECATPVSLVCLWDGRLPSSKGLLRCDRSKLGGLRLEPKDVTRGRVRA
jgi:hypothetical protein